MGSSLIPILLVVAAILGAVAVVIFLVQRRKDQTKDTDGDEVCRACGGTDLQRPEPFILQCQTCGFEDGLAADSQPAEDRYRRISAATPEERIAGAAADLRAAVVHLHDCLSRAKHLSSSLTLEPDEREAAGLLASVDRLEESLQYAADRIRSLRPDEVPPSVNLSTWTLARVVEQFQGDRQRSRLVGDLYHVLLQLRPVMEAHRAMLFELP